MHSETESQGDPGRPPSGARVAVRVVTALAVGAVLLVAARWALTWVWRLGSVTWGPDDPPVRADQRVADTTTLLFSMLLAARAAAGLAGDRVRAVLVSLVVLAGGFAVVQSGPTGAPLWYRVVLISMIPAGAYFAWLVEDDPGASD